MSISTDNDKKIFPNYTTLDEEDFLRLTLDMYNGLVMDYERARKENIKMAEENEILQKDNAAYKSIINIMWKDEEKKGE